MNDETPRPTGLSPTLRQLAILVVWAALLLAATRLLLDWGVLGVSTRRDCLTVAILVAGWPVPLLTLLLHLLDRRGPVRRWYIARCLSLWGLVSGLALLLADPVCWALQGRTSAAFPFLSICALVTLPGIPGAWRWAAPGRCVRCGRKAVIRLATRTDRPGGWTDSGWCAACGARYERKGTRGGWRPLGESQADRDAA